MSEQSFTFVTHTLELWHPPYVFFYLSWRAKIYCVFEFHKLMARSFFSTNSAKYIAGSYFSDISRRYVGGGWERRSWERRQRCVCMNNIKCFSSLSQQEIEMTDSFLLSLLSYPIIDFLLLFCLSPIPPPPISFLIS